jgi:hypothetical protein
MDRQTDRHIHRTVVTSALQVCNHIHKQLKYIRHMNEAGSIITEEMENQRVQPGSSTWQGNVNLHSKQHKVMMKGEF